MTRSHRTKRNDGKLSRGRNGAALDGRSAMSKTVMIVEDNELNMKLFHDLLEALATIPSARAMKTQSLGSSQLRCDGDPVAGFNTRAAAPYRDVLRNGGRFDR